MTNIQNPTHVVTGRTRLSYCNLLQPKAAPGSDTAKYSVTILVPKSDAATMEKINAAIEAATAAGVAKKWNGYRPPVVPNPVHDGDGARPSDGAPFGAECRGCWVFTASNTNPPRIVDTALNDILDGTQIYSGMYARVGVDFFPYSAAGKKGIGCSLVNVQKLEDGEPLGGGRASVEDDFGDGLYAPCATPAPTAPAAPAYPAYPQQTAPRFDPMTGQMV